MKGDLEDIKFPPGFRFEPHDLELIVHYLLPKLENKELPPNLMHSVNLYQNNPELCDPHNLTELYKAQGKGKWYFFTSRDRKYPNGSLPNRAAGGGYWKATGCDSEICKISEQEAGYKKTLVFYTGKPRSQDSKKTNWLMHEYRIGPVKNPRDPETSKKKRKNDDEASNSQSMKLDEWVLRKIYHANDEKCKSNKGNKGKGNATDAYHGFAETQVQPEEAQHAQRSFVNNSRDEEQKYVEQLLDMMVHNYVPVVNVGFQPSCSDLENIQLSAQRINGNVDPVDYSSADCVINKTHCPPVKVFQHRWSDLENMPSSAASNYGHSSISYSAERNNVNIVHVDNSGADDVMNDNHCPQVNVGVLRQWCDLKNMPSSVTSSCVHSSVPSSAELINGNIVPVPNANSDGVMNDNHSTPINAGIPLQWTSAMSNYGQFLHGGSDPKSMPSLSTSKDASSSIDSLEGIQYDDTFDIGDLDIDFSSLPDFSADFTTTEFNFEKPKIQTTSSGQQSLSHIPINDSTKSPLQCQLKQATEGAKPA